MSVLQSGSLCLELAVKRSMRSLLPWVAELDLTRASSDERWGCQMAKAKDGSNSLEVAVLDPAGVVARWNSMNPALAVRPGDRIMAVNKEFRPDRVLACLQDPTCLACQWIIARGVHNEGPQPPEADY